MKKIWIDDVRPAPPGYTWAKTVNEAKIYFTQMHKGDGHFNVAVIDIDHDAGSEARFGGDYIEFLNWLEERSYEYGWEIPPIHIHSQNAVGIKNMRAIIKHNHWTEIR
jgi:hypothetical protein